MCLAVISPSFSWLPTPAIGEDDVEGAALGLHRRVKSVEVGLVGDRALHRAGIGPELGHGGVERFLPAAEDEDEGALLDEALCRGEADAGRATRGSRRVFPVSLVMTCILRFRRLKSLATGIPESLHMGLPASGDQCGIAHMGWCKIDPARPLFRGNNRAQWGSAC